MSVHKLVSRQRVHRPTQWSQPKKNSTPNPKVEQEYSSLEPGDSLIPELREEEFHACKGDPFIKSQTRRKRTWTHVLYPTPEKDQGSTKQHSLDLRLVLVMKFINISAAQWAIVSCQVKEVKLTLISTVGREGLAGVKQNGAHVRNKSWCYCLATGGFLDCSNHTITRGKKSQKINPNADSPDRP